MSTLDAIESQPPYQPNPKPEWPADPWGYASSSEVCTNLSGIADGRDAAIEEGLDAFSGREEFYVASLRPIPLWHLCPEAEEIVDQMHEQANDEDGEWRTSAPNEEAQVELNELLKAWCDKHDTCNWYEQAGEAERIEVTP